MELNVYIIGNCYGLLQFLYSGKTVMHTVIALTGLNALPDSATSLYAFFDTYDLHITVICIVLLLLTLTSYFTTVIKLKKERFHEAFLAESRISKKLHDEIANEIYGTIHHIEKNNTISGNDREKLISNLNSIYNSTRNLSHETALINTGINYPEHLKILLNDYSSQNINIIIKDIDNVNWCKICHIKKITLYRVLQELMVNMKKHSNASIVVLAFSHKYKVLKVKYNDNGTGLPENFIRKNGLQNVENRMDTINGTAIFENTSGKGLNLTLSFPVYDIYV